MTDMDALGAAVARIAWDETGRFGLVARDLSTGREVAAGEPDQPMPLASCFKVPLLATLEARVAKGEISWQDRHVLTDADKSPGSGILVDLEPGLSLSLNDLATLMIYLSDNTATDILFAICGRDRIHAFLNRHGIAPMSVLSDCKGLLADFAGVTVQAIQSVPPAEKQAMLSGPMSPKTKAFSEELEDTNLASPRAMADLLEGVARATVLPAERARHMLGIMAGEWYRHRIPARLPAGVRWATKSGSIGHVLNDVGVIFGERGPIVFSMFARDLAHPERWERVIARSAAAVYDAFARD